MSQNVSSAVMQQRTEPKDSLDDFPTPPWATRALCEFLIFNGLIEEGEVVEEPACNRGHMVKALREYFCVIPSDIHDYGCGFDVRDYLTSVRILVPWTITNPPFRLAKEFFKKARKRSMKGVAFFVRTAFLESVGRYNGIFANDRPSHILQFSERVVIHKGKLAPKGSTATAYCWVIWTGKPRYTLFHWIPPCRKSLERPEDYLDVWTVVQPA